MIPTPMATTPRESKPRVKKEKKEKRDDKAKRPMNAFMLFAQKYRVYYTQRYPGRDNRYITVYKPNGFTVISMIFEYSVQL